MATETKTVPDKISGYLHEKISSYLHVPKYNGFYSGFIFFLECIQSLGQEHLLEKGMATHSRILAWRIPWSEEPSRLQSMGLQRVGHE